MSPAAHAVSAAADRAVAWASRTAQHLSSVSTIQTPGAELDLVPAVPLDETKGVPHVAGRVTTSQSKAMVAAALPAPAKPRPAAVPPPPAVEPTAVPPVAETPPAPPPSPPGEGSSGATPNGNGNGASGGGRAVAQPAPAPAPLLPRIASSERSRPRDAGRTPFTPPVVIAGSVGAIGLAMGAIGSGFGDGPVEPGFAIAGAGIGVIGLATAGILLLVQPDDDEPRQMAMGIGPGSATLSGRF